MSTLTISPPELEAEFVTLASQWRRETSLLSFARQKAMHPAYQKIIGMGPAALPFIFRELKHQGGDWIWALEMIDRRENPAAGATQFEQAVAAWTQWGRDHGFDS